MTDETPESGFDESPTSTAGLWFSLRTLFERFGRTESAAFGAVINCGLAAIGVLIALVTSGVISWLALAWTGLNLWPVFSWVIGR